jgi:transcriptional regulator with XRE-family HTH domain
MRGGCLVKAVKVRRSIDVEVEGLGAKIQKAIKSDGRAVKVLANAAGMSRVHWYDIESEKIRDSLPEETLRKIEEVLGVDLGVKFNDQ